MPITYIKPAKKKNTALLVRILVGFIIGILFGFIVGPFINDYPILSDYVMPFIELSGKIFMRLLMMLIVPLVFSSLVAGLSSIGDPMTLKRIGLKTLS
ncbi:MAG: cation:dicarboxylase symporter family transporter, partial [Synergistaceae bacterium]|nr:cation:dicarboxylase symporter family transporter [Synergistaceae bacterium]